MEEKDGGEKVRLGMVVCYEEDAPNRKLARVELMDLLVLGHSR